ncbi:AraC family transcriptional regulator [Niallia sp. FSL K6-0077]|uniref:AraC family transcriptional regulator n=1 Tax=Niallia sp. FSL K6-0077 TaxID=2954743 RepID=UPI0030F772DD
MEKQKAIPILKETAFLEKYVSLSIYSNNRFEGNIIVGPVINFRMTDETITSSLRDMDIRVAKEEMLHYYSNLPILSNLKFIKFSMMIYYMIYQKQLNILDIVQTNKEIEKENLNIEPIDNQIIESRQNKNVHTDISLEKKFLNYIKIGKKTGLLESFHAINKQGKKGILSKTSYLRSQKNIAISLITLATRAAVEGGLYQEIAYSLSDSYIIKLEELSNSRAVDQLIENALIDFAERVENSKKYKYSKPINICQTYIFNHLYENITLSELANLTGLNPNYLSNLFKKEVGISIKAFIQKTKIDEAKNLLSYSNYSLTEISTLLNFHDQSYFTRIFKLVTGITPKQYINKNC